MTDKALWILSGILLVYAGYAGYQAHKYELKYTQIATTLEAQTHELDRYKNQRPQVVEKIATKYIKVPVSTSTCEATLESAKSLLREFAE